MGAVPAVEEHFNGVWDVFTISPNKEFYTCLRRCLAPLKLFLKWLEAHNAMEIQLLSGQSSISHAPSSSIRTVDHL